MCMGIRAGKFWTGWKGRRYSLHAPTWMAQRRSIWMARPLFRLLFAEPVCRLDFFRRLAVIFDQPASFCSVLFAHQDDSATYSGQNVLNSIEGSDVGVDSGRIEQAANHHGFRLLLRIEYPHQLFIRIRTALTVPGPRIYHGFSNHEAKTRTVCLRFDSNPNWSCGRRMVVYGRCLSTLRFRLCRKGTLPSR